MILGINGFTGWHFQHYIQRRKLEETYSFVGVDQSIKRPIGMKYIRADLGQYTNLAKILRKEKPDYVINLVGLLRGENLEDLVRVNADVSRNLLDIILKYKMPIKKVLLIGSAAEYGLPKHLPVNERGPLSPVSDYGLSKVIQSQYAHYYFNNHAINVNIVRTFNVIGRFIAPSLSIGSFLNQIKNTEDGGRMYVGNLETKRDFIDIEDVVDGYWKILFKGKSGEVYNLCSGKSVLMKDLLTYMIKKSHKQFHIVVKPAYIKQVDVLDIYGDDSKVKRDTGWKPKFDIYSALDKLDYS